MGKNILFITHLYWPSIGGAELLYQQLAEKLVELGHHVSVITTDVRSTNDYFNPAAKKISKESDIHNGVFIYRINWKKGNSFIRVVNVLGRFSPRLLYLIGPLFYGPYFSMDKFMKIINERKWNVILAGPTPTMTFLYALLAKRKSQAKFIAIPCMHIDDNYHHNPMIKFSLRKADHIFALTNSERDYILNTLNLKGNVSTLGIGVSETLLSQPQASYKEPYVLFIGQEGKHKQILLLLKAMNYLWAQDIDIQLVIAGVKTNYSEVIEKYIHSLPNDRQKYITRINNFSDDKKRELLDGSLFLINPSSQESFGIVFLEAWARKKAVIGARSKAIRDVVGDAGLLFKPNSAISLSNTIKKLIEDAELRERLAENGQRRIRTRYNWNTIIDVFAKQF